jgi:neutral amino acid transport system ATP-binding protein
MLAPRLVLLDEPLAGVNPTLGRRLLEHIEAMRTRDGTTVLFVEHDMEVVMNHSDRVIVMAQGRVIAEGSAQEVRQNETVVEAYLGKLVVD